MSMSEFERRLRGSENDLSHLSLSQNQALPDDFSEEELEFARELATAFSPEKEELPPFFVQTLLEPESPRFQPAEPDFEHKTRIQVFRRLKLQRRLFHSHRSVAQLLPVQRPFAALVAALLLFMLTTMVATSNSFAAGMVYLFSGPHSGVIQLHAYPAPAQQSTTQQTKPSNEENPPRLSLLEMQQNLDFKIHWPTYLPAHYSVDSVNIYKGSENVWTDGPIMQLVCTLSLPGVQPHGTGNINVLELKPLGNGKVLQGVAINSSHQIKIGSNGEPGLVINGQWHSINKTTHTWVDNGSVELIYERNGIIFWIQGDQRDGIDKDGKVLAEIAKSLVPLDVSRMAHMSRFDGQQQSADDLGFSYVGDIYETDILVIANPDSAIIPARTSMHMS